MKITVKKNATNPFVQIHKEILSERRLSWKAKGLWTYLLSKPDNWVYRIEDIVKRSSDGHSSVYSGLKELEKVGYLVRVKLRDAKGRYTQTEFIIYEQLPQSDCPHVENPHLDKPALENQSVSNNKSSNIDFTNNKTSTRGSTEEKTVVGFLAKSGLSQNTISDLLKKYPVKQLQNNIDFIRKQNTSNIKNLPGFVISCIEKNEQLNDLEKQKLLENRKLQEAMQRSLNQEQSETYEIQDNHFRKIIEKNLRKAE